MKSIYFCFSLVIITFSCDSFRRGDSEKITSKIDSSVFHLVENPSDNLYADSITFFQDLEDNKKDEFVSMRISNETVLEFWHNKDIPMGKDFYLSVIKNFEKTGKNFDFYFYCIDIIENRVSSTDEYLIEIIQRYYEMVYDFNKNELFKYLRRQELIGHFDKVNDILNSIGFSFQSIIQEDPNYFQDKIEEDPLNREFYERIEKFALENI